MATFPLSLAHRSRILPFHVLGFVGHRGCTIFLISVDVSDIFYFFCSGERKGVGATGRVGSLLKIPGGEGVSQEGGPGRGGREGVCREFAGGGLNIFFRGRNARQVILGESILLGYF